MTGLKPTDEGEARSAYAKSETNPTHLLPTEGCTRSPIAATYTKAKTPTYAPPVYDLAENNGLFEAALVPQTVPEETPVAPVKRTRRPRVKPEEEATPA